MNRFDWNHLRAFHATAARGSLSAAAKELGLTQPTLSRQVQALEASLDMRLFARRGRRLILTQTGRELLDYTGSMQNAVDSFALVASGQRQEIKGRVCISATDSIAAYILPDIIAQLTAEAPQLTIEIAAANSISDLHQMEADIAIRHAAPARAGLIGQHIHNTEAYFYASKDWVHKNGEPAHMAELAKAGLIGFDDTDRLARHFRDMGIPITTEDFRQVSSSAVVVWEMVKRGLGVAAMLTEVAKQTPDVIRLLPDIAPTKVPLWLVTHKDIEASPRIRLVKRVLAEAFAQL